MMTRTETGVGTETRASTGKKMRAEVRAKTGVGTGTRVEMRGAGRESLEIFEVVIEVVTKMREGG